MHAHRGPHGHWLLGNALELRRDPLGLLTRAARDFGDVAELRLGPARLLLLSRPAHVAEVLVDRADDVAKSRLMTVAGRLVMGRALDALDGEPWAERMRAVAPAFRKARVAASRAVVEQEAARWLAEVTRVEADDVLRLATRIEARCILGVDLEAGAAGAGRAMREALGGWIARVRAGVPTPDWLPVPYNLRMRRAMTQLHAVVDATIADRRAAPGDRGDVLSAIVGAYPAGDRALRDDLTVMTFLGAHQVAIALAWALRLVAEHPAAEERLRAGDEPFAAAVVDETLRLYPPFPLLVRDATRAGVLGGVPFARGTTFAMSPWVTQRDARLFPEPDRFVPDRWTGGLASSLPRFAYFPFGAGPRVCIANALVRQQLARLLTALAAGARFAASGDRPRARAHVTLALPEPLGVTTGSLAHAAARVA
jgi:cytochrome P450